MIECKHRSLIRSVGKLHYANTILLQSYFSQTSCKKGASQWRDVPFMFPPPTPIFSYNTVSATRSNIRLKLFGQHSFLFGRTCGMPFSSDQKLMVPVTLHEKHNKQPGPFHSNAHQHPITHGPPPPRSSGRPLPSKTRYSSSDHNKYLRCYARLIMVCNLH